jgi:purine-nucleoside phosphorylase
VIAPILLIHALGIDKLVLTNAAGGINEDFVVGDIMLLKDHINMMGNNPLIGGNIHPDIPRFPDQTNIYNAELRNLVETQALEYNIKTKEGIYLAVSGPSFETPAEIRAFKKMGADAVGMSTVPEAIVANSLKMKICALSLISNQAAGKSPNELSHEEVSETANQILPKMKVLMNQILNSL